MCTSIWICLYIVSWVVVYTKSTHSLMIVECILSLYENFEGSVNISYSDDIFLLTKRGRCFNLREIIMGDFFNDLLQLYMIVYFFCLILGPMIAYKMDEFATCGFILCLVSGVLGFVTLYNQYKRKEEYSTERPMPRYNKFAVVLNLFLLSLFFFIG